MQDLKNLYEDLIQDVISHKLSYPENKLCVFNAKRGKDYDNKVMIIGRAVNGGENVFEKESKEDTQLVMNRLMSFIQNNTVNYPEQMIWDRARRYNQNKSAFTRMKRALAQSIIGCRESEANCNIIWSNLYKISHFDSGNPSRELKELQQSHCINILGAELELFKPDIAILLSGYHGWAGDFVKGLKMEQIERSELGNIKFVGKYKETKVVVAPHPQGKSKDKILSAIISKIK